MENIKHKIMIIDDHPIIHDGLKTLLNSETDLDISSTASSAKEAIQIIKKEVPDVAIVDLSLGDTDGIPLIIQLRKLCPELRILVYTMSEEKLFAERTASAGANGYVMKTSSPSELKEAIRTILSGELYFTPKTKKWIQSQKSGKNKSPRKLLDVLSNREMDIFKLIGEGMDTASISTHLSISRNTADTHRINIKNKLNLRNGKALDRLAYETIKRGKLPR
ncbi:MAG: response regulator transcription factor [Pontiella sp.]